MKTTLVYLILLQDLIESHNFAGNIELYPYTSDLLCLNWARPADSTVLPELSLVTTPLVSHAWEAALVSHPDRALVRYITEGLRLGFRIGFQRHSPLKPATCNMPSAREHLEVVQRYIEDELRKGRFLGPFHSSHSQNLHQNRFGVIPKGHNTVDHGPVLPGEYQRQ